jgi:hypothetical protein
MAGMEKKIAAALAAVNAYIQQEEESVCAQLAATVPASTPASQLNIWGMSGRQEMMAMRRLIQMRAFDRFR